MKKILYIVTLISLVMISACRKSDNATMLDGIVYLNQPAFQKVLEGFDESIAFQDPLAFKGKFTIGLKFTNEKKPKYFDIVIMKNGDLNNIKVLKEKVSVMPTEIEITGPQIEQIFGTAIALNDDYDIGANYITEDDKTYEAFPKNGESGYGSGVISQPGAGPTIRYSCICKFDMDDFLGDGKFEVIVDDWDDFGVGTIVDLQKIDERTFNIPYPIPGFQPIKVVVNPGDNSLNVAKQPLGDYGVGWQYGIISVASVGGPTVNLVNPCDETIKINGTYTVSAGGFGTYPLELKKK